MGTKWDIKFGTLNFNWILNLFELDNNNSSSNRRSLNKNKIITIEVCHLKMTVISFKRNDLISVYFIIIISMYSCNHFTHVAI